MIQKKQVQESDLLKIKKYLVSKCIQDPNFKRQFLADAKKTIETEFNIDLPNEAQITALEETTTHIYIVLPSISAIESGQAEAAFEMSDEELKSIVGGRYQPANLLEQGFYTIGKFFVELFGGRVEK